MQAWIFPSNPSIKDYNFNAMEEFKKNKIQTWNQVKQTTHIQIGDIVFLYISKPEQALAIQTRVNDVKEQVIELELIRFLNPEIPLADLEKIGISVPYGPKRINEKQLEFIENYPQSRDNFTQYDFGNRQYWLYKPGEQGNRWEKMYDKGLMGIGWRKLGDLTKYKNANEIESRLNAIEPASSENRMNDKAANWDICNTIKEGDIVIAASGRNKLLGYGEVVSGYFYDESIDDEFASFRKVDWYSRGSWDVLDALPIKTLTEITRKGERYLQKLLAIMDGENISGSLDTTLDSIKSMRENIPLNQILFGPPGTGKTYHTINNALEILGFATKDYKNKKVVLDDEKIKQEVTKLGLKIELKENQNENRAMAKALFDYFKQKGQIAFVTFHQSYGYEEFVEGIKPDVESNEVRYEIKSGIFKRLCEDALKNYTDSQKEPAILQKEYNLDELLERYANYVIQELAEGREPKFESVKDWKTTMKIQDVYPRDSSKFASIVVGISGSNRQYYLSRKIIKRDYEKFKLGIIKEYKDIKPSMTSSLKWHGQAGYYFVLYHAIADFEVSQFQPSVIENVEQKPYILIVDEINRGNIAKILGELITLLESSKRIGEPEELRVNLPYSGDEFDSGKGFGVPKNLYIIGTMNTADRSIALLDTALRRRFEFIEMMPDSEHERLSEDCDGVNLKKLLEFMNKRIIFLLDREHQIGHSFFLDVKNINDLRAIFAKKIIPLLQEYFYDDYAKINAVLNNNGMIQEIKQGSLASALSEFVDSEKVVYEIAESSNWQEWQFQKIYDDNAKPKNTDSAESSPAESADEPSAE